MKLRTLDHYISRQVYGAVMFVLFGFLALFAFFDLIRELGDLGKGDYHLRQVALYVLLSVPTHSYELFPVVVLIGSLYACLAVGFSLIYGVLNIINVMHGSFVVLGAYATIYCTQMLGLSPLVSAMIGCASFSPAAIPRSAARRRSRSPCVRSAASPPWQWRVAFW